eukprot:6827896-Pyramimonas_sp.AAC.1
MPYRLRKWDNAADFRAGIGARKRLIMLFTWARAAFGMNNLQMYAKSGRQKVFAANMRAGFDEGAVSKAESRFTRRASSS